MNTETKNDIIINEARKRMDEIRKRTIRYNLLMTLFFCIIILGLFESVIYYNRMSNLNLKLKSAQDSLTQANKLLDSQRNVIAIERSKSDNFLLLSRDANKHDTAVINEFVAKIVTSRDTARKLADAGYKMLIKHDFQGALKAFHDSEQAYNGYRDSYEVYILLWKNKQNLNNPATQEQLIQTIMKNYDTYGLLKKYYKAA